MIANSGPASYHKRLHILGGAGLLCYRALWLVLFAGALLSTFYFAVRNEVDSQTRYEAAASLGFYPYLNVSAEGQLGEGLGEEGRQLGFKQGDLLIAVDGHPLPADPAGRMRLMSGPKGSIAALELRRSTGELHSMRVARDPQRLARAYAGTGLTVPARRWIQFLFEDGATVVGLLAAALLFVRRPRDTVAQLLSFSFVLPAVNLPDFANIGQVALVGFQAVQFIIFTMALLLFPDGRFNTKWHWAALAICLTEGATNMILVFESSYSVNILVAMDVLTYSSVILAVVMQYRKSKTGITRQQLKFMMLGITAGASFFLIQSLLLFIWAQPILSNTSIKLWLILAEHLSGALGFIAIFAGLLVSLLRFRLYDAETAISRSVVYGALTLFLLAIFAGSEKVIELLGEKYFGEHLGALAGGLGAAIAAVMVAPLHHRVTHWAERRFQGDLVYLRQGLPLLVGDLRETATPERLADAVLARVEAGVRASHGAVIVAGEVLDARDIDIPAVREWLSSWREPADDMRSLDADREDPLFPLRVPLYADGTGMAGWLVLGPRPDGSFYGKDERETLLAVADPIARALVIARDRERNLGGLSAEMSLLKGWLEEIRARMSVFEARLA